MKKNIEAKSAVSTLEADQAVWNAKLEELKTKSAVIRYLAVEWNGDRGRIAKAGNIIYQHVRNVLTKELKKPTMREAVAGDIGCEPVLQ